MVGVDLSLPLWISGKLQIFEMLPKLATCRKLFRHRANQNRFGVHGWHPCRDADFKWTFSGGVASLNHRLQDVMPPVSLHLVFESGAYQWANQNFVLGLK
jgi:hypothetical protein